MEWAPKLLDNIDSSLYAMHLSWAGYYRWIHLCLLGAVMAVTALIVSPMARLLVVAMVTTYVSLEIVDRAVIRRKPVGRVGSRGLISPQ